MNFKVVKILKDRQIAKYYDSEKVAQQKAEYKGWKLAKHEGDILYSARGINKGAVQEPSYEVEIVDLGVKFGCPTEGLTNQIVELLTLNYKDVRARRLVVKSSVQVEEVDCDL